MLSREENELLVRVGPGTPMGELMRRFWLPALLESELPERDGKPVRVRLLGENLVAFRDTEGRIGLLDEHCPHRRASLALAVNEECGLRCLYHGWKFDVNGQCVDTPTEPEGSGLAKRMRVTSYPVHVAGGMVWTYMGPAEEKPVFPEFPWLSMEEGHAEPFKLMEDCNYAQAVEGTVDSAHAGVLHRSSPWTHEAKYPHEKDLRPKLEVEMTNYGLRYCAVRSLNEEMSHARVTQVVLPFWTFIPPDGGNAPEFRRERRLVNAFVPRDDYSTWHIQWFFDEKYKIDREHRNEEGGHWHDENFRKLVNKDNWYKQDRDMMKTENLSGIVGVVTQDHAVSETQGPILDRTKEHLGRSDMAVVAWRRAVMRAAAALQEGEKPKAATAHIDWSQVTAETFTFPKTSEWKKELPLPNEFRADISSAA
ncbi:Rieske 2Fe-2S domain-containing protein [Hyphococcus luteus]|uniref:(2Fe-2S)-binding protein n=1 Tax=Hyphococcus luteus TaxID=2058213 RepID=A0A2S7K576_9PROT|nr:Rieske 2Fe-2S domain-containing protein [Marinicaulis flavus]PQA87626.1 (2Fe-2S)-binding protein [Marinicaulis flavus]